MRPEPASRRSLSTDLVFKVERGCDANRQGLGCGCLGICRERIEVVKAVDYYRLLGRIEQLERMVPQAFAPQVSYGDREDDDGEMR